jgi:hypothetical protein
MLCLWAGVLGHIATHGLDGVDQDLDDVLRIVRERTRIFDRILLVEGSLEQEGCPAGGMLPGMINGTEHAQSHLYC